MTFQIFLECYGFFARTKCNNRLDVPGTVLSSVGNLTGIVSPQAGFNIRCNSRVMADFVNFTG